VAVVAPAPVPAAVSADVKSPPAKPKSFDTFVQALRSLAATTPGGIIRPKDCPAVINKVKELTTELVSKKAEWWKDAYWECDANKGFSTHILHHEPDATLAVIIVSWLPGRSVPPHNHGTWSVVYGLHGQEKNSIWKRSDAKLNDSPLVLASEETFDAGKFVTFEPDTIHSVLNMDKNKSVSLHVYGWHLPNKTEFWIYPNGNTEDLRKYQPDETLHRGKSPSPTAAASPPPAGAQK